MKKKDYNLTEGPIFKTLLTYSTPIIITNVVQLLFVVADITILALLVDDNAVAAVGACGSLITLLVGLFTGFATGADVLLTRRIGGKFFGKIKTVVGTSIVVGFISGVILMLVGVVFARDLLQLMNCQPAVLDDATKYLVSYFIGMPIIMLYTFISSIFRAFGDSIRPMKYMLITGFVKIGLNLLMTGSLSVIGVALATNISNLIALSMALYVLFKKKVHCEIKLCDIKAKKEELLEIIKVGVPTCFCSIFFYIANVILSSVINDISTDAMAANTIAGQFDSIIYNVGCSIAIATSVIIGQNYGAGNFERIKKTMRVSIVYTTVVSLSLGLIFVLFSDFILSMMSDNPAIIDIAKSKLILLCLTYFITSIMEVFSFSLRTMGKAIVTMIVGGICGLGIRGAWAWLICPVYKTLPVVFQSYAVSAFAAIVIYVIVYRKTMKKNYALYSK